MAFEKDPKNFRPPTAAKINLFRHLSFFRAGPPQAEFFFGLFALVWHVFLLFFKGKSIKTQPKTPKIFRPSGPDIHLNPPLLENLHKQGGGLNGGYRLMYMYIVVNS